VLPEGAMQTVHDSGFAITPFEAGQGSSTAKRVVRFHRLPEHVRHRFAAALAASPEAPGSPIASESIGRTRARVTMVVLCLLGASMAYILFQARGMLAVDGQAIVFLALCLPAVLIFGTIASRLATQNPFASLPFRPGRYLFALDYVDARGPSLVIRPLTRNSVRCTHYYVNGGYASSSILLTFDDGTKELFTFGDRAMAEWALGKLNGVRTQMAQAAAYGDRATLAALDPFHGL
jgi:hypothetical protein